MSAGGVKAVALASRLLRDAAQFFEAVGEQNPGLAEQMADNADVYRRIADRLDADPTARVAVSGGRAEGGGPPIVRLAAKLLDDAATFFGNVGAQNPALAEQMNDNAGVFRAMAELILADPDARLPTDA